MRRDIDSLTSEEFDIVVVGGGIYGACAALEAGRSGLRACLIEKEDFGAGTSANSLRVLHGGLRYLQHLDIRRMRESVRARRGWFRSAPHLVQPMEFRLPTFGYGLRGPVVHWAAMHLNNLGAIGSNKGVVHDKHLGSASFSRGTSLLSIGEQKCCAGANGVARWFDGVMLDSERLLIEITKAAARAGVVVANYVEAEALLTRGREVRGVRAKDVLTSQLFEVRAPWVLNTAGPWVDEWLPSGGQRSTRAFVPARAFNLLVRRVPVEYALGVPTREAAVDGDLVFRKGYKTNFIIPWGSYSLVGTKQLPIDRPAADRVDPALVRQLLAEINDGLGFELLREEDVLRVYEGLLPGKAGTHDTLMKSALVRHHGDESEGPKGLVTVVGGKWTTANTVAKRAVLGITARMGHRGAGSSACEPSPFVAQRSRTEEPSNVARYVDEEMAVRLSDVIFRRTQVGCSGFVPLVVLEEYAAAMGKELSWSSERRQREVDTAVCELSAIRYRGSAPTTPVSCSEC